MAKYATILHTEEGMRDGLQIENPDIPVSDKIRLLNALSETGLSEIAVGSFASPKWTPQMASIDDIVKGFTPKPGVRYTYSAYNDRGMERARALTPPLSERIREYQLGVTMCDVFAQRNYNRTQAQEIAKWPKQVEKALARGMTDGGIHLSAAFGSNWTGEFSLEQRLTMLDLMYRLWADASTVFMGLFDVVLAEREGFEPGRVFGSIQASHNGNTVSRLDVLAQLWSESPAAIIPVLVH